MRDEVIPSVRHHRRALTARSGLAAATVATPRARGSALARAWDALGEDRRRAVSETWSVFWLTRLVVIAIATVAAGTASAISVGNRFRLDVPGITHPIGGVIGDMFTSLARWDAVWYLSVAHHGYTVEAGGAARSTAFFPLYPLLVRLFAGLSHSPGPLLVASYVVSLATFAFALYLVHRLVTLELGPQYARPTLLLLAIFPVSFIFSAPYSESLFLLISVGAFYAARTGRFAVAGCLAAAASATRNEGILLVVPLAVLYLYGPRTDAVADAPRRAGRLARLAPRFRPRHDLAFLALAPLGLAAYSLHLALSVGDGLAPLHLEHEWYRGFAGPLGGIWDGTRAAFDGVLQYASGSRAHHYFAAAGGDPFVAAGHNITLFVFLVLAIVATVGVARRLPAAYAAYVIASLALPLSFPVATQPLQSLPRYLIPLFPIFMWLALATRRGRRRELLVGAFALGLGVATAEFATWHWVT